MGGEQAASVLATVHRDADSWSAEEEAAFKAPIRQLYERRGQPVLRHRAPVGRRRDRPGADAGRAGAGLRRVPERGGGRAGAVRGVPDVNALTHDTQGYRLCMQEFKQRLLVFNVAMTPVDEPGKYLVGNVELAALQLRKMYELVGFASLSANLERYAKARKRYEKDWNLADILGRIERVNPTFLPHGLDETYIDYNGRPTLNIADNGLHIDKRTLLAHHGRLGQILHAKNPYSEEVNYSEWHAWLHERATELVALMTLHAVSIEYRKTLYRVAMRDEETDDVLIVVMNFELEEHK